MTTSLYPGAPFYTISGTGPYAINHEYTADAISPQVVVNGVMTDLASDEFTLSAESGDSGNLFLTTAAAADYAGATLIVLRSTVVEQGWQGAGGARELSLERQLDRHAQGIQEVQDKYARTLRGPVGADYPQLPALTPFATLRVNDLGTGFAMGPTTGELLGENFKASRPELVAWWSEGLMPAGGVVFDGLVAYKVQPGATAISDLPGLVPFLDIRPDHWGYNAVPGVTDMAAVAQNAINYAGTKAGADEGADRTAAAVVTFLAQVYYFSTGVSWDSSFERVWLEGNGATIETDTDGPLISMGDSVMFTPGADTTSSTEVYNNKIKGFVFRHTGATETNPIAIRMGRAWNTVIEENHFWDFGTFIDCFNCGQLWMQQNKFFIRSRTATSEAILRLRGAYNSTNNYQPGSGINLIKNEVSGKPSAVDPTSDTITAVAHGFADGEVVRLTSNIAMPGGLATGTDYWVDRVNANSFRLCSSLANWSADTYIDITSTGSGLLTITDQPVTTTVQVTQGQLKRVWWVQSVDGLYYANNHCQHYEKGLVIDPTGEDDNYQNNVVIEVLSGGANYWDDPAPGGRNVSIEGKVAYAGTSGQQNGNIKNVKFAPGDYLRGAGRGTYGVYMDLVDDGGFVTGRGGVSGLGFQGTYEQHRGSAIWLSRDGATKVPAVKPRISAAFAAGRRGSDTGGTSYILLNTKGAHISDCTFGEEDFAPDRAISIACSDYTNSEVTIVGNDLRDTASTSDCIQLDLGATDLLTAAANSVPAGDTSSAGGNVLHNGLMVDGRRVNGHVFANRAAAAAADIVGGLLEIYVRTPDGHILSYIRDASGTALTTNDGRKWSPAGTKYPDHWGENATPGTTDMTTAINTMIAFGGRIGGRLLDSDYLITGPIVISGKANDSSTEDFIFEGAGVGMTNIINSAPETDWIQVTKGNDYLTEGYIRGTIRDLSILSDDSNRPTRDDEGAGIRLTRTIGVRLENLEIDAPTFPIVMEDSDLTIAHSLYFRNVKRPDDAGSLITCDSGPGERTQGQRWSNIEAQAGQNWEAGLDIKGLDGFYLSNSHMNNLDRRIWIRPTGCRSNDRCYNLHVSNVYFDGALADGDGVVIEPSLPNLTLEIDTASEVNAGTDVIVAVAHGAEDGQIVRITSSGTMPGGLAIATDYWVKSLGANSFRLCSSLANWQTNTYIDITSTGSGTLTIIDQPGTDTIEVKHLYFTNTMFRRGDQVVDVRGTLNGLVKIEDVIFHGCEFQDFTGVWFDFANASYTDATDQLQKIVFNGNIFEDGPTNTADNPNLFIVSGKNFSITNNMVQGNWTNAGGFVYQVEDNADNVLFSNNLHDVPRTSGLYTVDASAGRVFGVWRSNSDGEWILRPDGTLECQHALTLPFKDANTCWDDWTYPSGDIFADDPHVTVMTTGRTGIPETDVATPNVIHLSGGRARVRQPRAAGGANFITGDSVDVTVRATGQAE